ncbi:MAG: adenylosuccinate synthase [Spirochaetales bacterium]|nr:adenylosuccinate synthase [Spirochaetales bacterium]
MNVVVIGAQWGDEGKGKIVDYLAVDADVVIRFSGGANAGHTIVTGENTYKLHLIPSGIVYPEKKVILGTGMVIDPEALFEELDTLEKNGIHWQGRVLISDRAHIVLPRYKEEDRKRDSERKYPLGTTGRGIGTTYGFKAMRESIRFAEFFDGTAERFLNDEDLKYLEQYRELLKELVIDLPRFTDNNRNMNILLEGAQGTLLDIDYGTYPYVSSGLSSAGGAAIGGSLGPKDIDRILGVFKAYSTRVGNGPFPSEFDAERDKDLSELVRELGREYGVTTGRPRRCGFLDLVALKYACRINSLDSLVMTHLDVYDQFESISACVGYSIDGEEIDYFPSSVGKLEQAKPIIKTFPGWGKTISNINNYDDLPREARSYLTFIEEYTETPIEIVSVGYKRRQTIVKSHLWTQF